jgi:hypothetical protein
MPISAADYDAIFDSGYRRGYRDGLRKAGGPSPGYVDIPVEVQATRRGTYKPKRKLSAWNKFVKANSKKKIYRYANGKLKLKKMGIAFRKTRAGRKR